MVCLVDKEFIHTALGEITEMRPMGAPAMRWRALSLMLDGSDYLHMSAWRRFWQAARSLPYAAIGVTHFFPLQMARMAPVLADLNAEALMMPRNGVQVVDSYFHHNDRSDVWYHNFMTRMLGPVYQREFHGKSEPLDLFSALCLFWASQRPVAEAVADNPRCRVQTFESLTTDVDAFQQTWRWMGAETELTPEQVAAKQGRDINRKSRGDRSPEAIWGRWSPEQREIFNRYCGEAMGYFGYGELA
ncbi:hypothetical protein MAIT1_03848 [Magnetofaba australis IT-1]|uniref:Uncharacterized protein n=2 Tax=Magnetofaba TaxID=1472292 RepID=A0A1Y2K962_9PROT|nr:hypothetical protein MAIT1_03848 [Magnetofaba australis IT-1]